MQRTARNKDVHSRGVHSRAPHLLERLESRLLLSSTVKPPINIGGLGDDIGIAGMALGPVPNAITYVTGTFNGTITVNLPGATASATLISKGGTDVFLIAIQANNVLWAKSFGGTGNDTAGGVVFANGSVYVVGSFSGTMDADPGAGITLLTSQGSNDAFLSRFSTAGNLVSALSFGGPGIDTANRIEADAAGNLYLMGVFSGTADLDPGSGVTFRTSANQFGDVFLSKTTSTGNLIWVDRFTSDDTLQVGNLAVSADGIAVFGATFRGNADINGTEGGVSIISSNVLEGVVEKVTADGSLDWKQLIGVPTTSTVSTLQINDLTMDSSGNIIFGGEFNGTVDLDPSSAMNVVSTFPVLGAGSGSDAFFGFVEKLDTAGDHVWSGPLNGDAATEVFGVATDASGNVFITGDFRHVMDLDIFAGIHNLLAPLTGGRSAFVARYDPNGNFEIEQQPTLATGESHGLMVVARNDVGVIFGGTFTNSLTFVDDTSNTLLTSNGGFDNFVLQINPFVVPATVTLQSSQTLVFPNQTFTLTANVIGQSTGSVAFMDSTGQTIFGVVPVNSNGVATLQIVMSAAGTVVFKALYDNGIDPTSTSGTVSVTAKLPDVPIGGVDTAAAGIVQGWAADLRDNTLTLVVQIIIDGFSRGTVLANENRPDLVPLVGNANHGFSFALPPLAAGTHTITAVTFDPSNGAGVVIGTTHFTSGSLYFDEAYYRAHNPDVAAAIAAGVLVSGYQHFTLIGAHEGRNPSPFFNEFWYRNNNPDVAAAIAAGSIPSGFAQFTAAGTHEGRDPSPLFNEAWYRRANSDVASAVAGGSLFSGFTHFLEAGLYEGRAATPWYNDAEYRAANPDVASALANGTLQAAYLHFVTSGITEVRAPSSLYVESAYLAMNTDVGSAVTSGVLPSGLSHFINTGFFEGRVSDPTFDTAFYLSAHPEVNGLIADGTVKSAFQHYLLFGQLQGFAKHA